MSRASFTARYAESQDSLLISQVFQYTSNTGKIPANHDFSADRSIIGENQ